MEREIFIYCNIKYFFVRGFILYLYLSYKIGYDVI